MLKLAPQKTVAAISFVAALGASLVALPLLLDSQALAFDAKEDAAGPTDDPMHHHPLPSEMIEPRLAFLKTALKITDAQGRQWNAIADVMRKHAKERDETLTAMRAYKDANLTIVDRLQQRQKMMTKDAAELSELIAAVQPLYATFSDEQKRLADEFLLPQFGHRGFGRDGYHGHRWE